jgi:hypothetical protein
MLGEGFSGSLNVLCKGLRIHTYMKFDLKKCFSVLKVLVWVRIRTGSGFSNSLDPDPDFAKYLNRDSVNPDQTRNTALVLKHSEVRQIS